MRSADCHPERKYYARGMCERCYNRAWAASHPEQKRAHRRKAYWKDPGRWREKIREWRLKAWYGVTPDWVEAQLLSQEGACRICRRPFSRTPHVDHSHSSGRARGLLCIGCNTLVGHLEHPLRPAAEAYLESYG